MNFSKEESERLKNSLTIENIEKILNKLNAQPIVKGDIILSRTICHDGDSHKLYYYDNTKLFKCYTQCNEDSFDIYELLIKVYAVKGIKITLNNAINKISSFIGYNFNNKNNFTLALNKENLIDNQKYLLDIENKIEEEYNFKIYDNSILKNLKRVIVKEWIKEGISEEAQFKYEIRFYPVTGQIVIPHYDINNNLIGIRGRYLDEKNCELYGKYRPIFMSNTLYSHPLSFSLYGINFNSLAIFKAKKAIIFESEKSVLMYHTYFGEKNNISVACCGSNISKQQIKLLLNLKVNEIIIAFDRQFKEIGDEENYKYIYNLLKISEKIINYCSVSVIYDKNNLLDYKDSPIDKGKEKFLKLFNERIEITQKEIDKFLKR